MTASSLLDNLTEQGAARPLPPRPGTTRAIAVGTIEVAEAQRSSDTFMRARWKERVRGSATPYLLIAADPEHPGRVRVLGPAHGNRPIQSVSAELLLDALQEVAKLPAFDAVRRIADDLTRIGGDGLTVNGLLTRHTLEYRLKGDPARWASAAEEVGAVKPTDSWQHVVRKLGYALQQLPQRGYLARYEGKPVALIHPKKKARDLARVDSQGRPPEGLLLSDCEAQGAQFAILAQGSRFRLFDAQSASPASEWLEVDIRLLQEERLPFLALLAPSFLSHGGFAALRSEARNFGVALHKRLDRTIRQDALPALAVGMQNWARERGMDLTDDRDRQELERAALTLVFRVVFILFCESAGHLPMGNPTYDRVSLSSLVREAHETMSKLSSASSALWSGFVRLVRAMRDGNPAWDVPAYNGALFASRDFDGAELLERLELRDPVFAKVLVAIGQDQETRRGADFSTLEIAHIGHTYESLLSLKLSLAKRPVRYDAKQDRYVQARVTGEAEVMAGGLLWQTHQGGRKAGGVYYTPVDIVRHLVKRAVLPAYERHLAKVTEIAKTDPERAARHLLSFAVVDPACGSAHFLVQVAETLAERTVLFLAEHPLPAIVEATNRLRGGASPGVEIDDMALLRPLAGEALRLRGRRKPDGCRGSHALSLVGVIRARVVAVLSGAERSAGRLSDRGDGFQHSYCRGQPVRGAGSKAPPEGHRDCPGTGGDRRPDTGRGCGQPASGPGGDTGDRRAQAPVRPLDGRAVRAPRCPSACGTPHRRRDRRHRRGHQRTLVKRARKLAATHGFLHWPLAFPQVFAHARPGFDVVVGNPPWEEVTIEELSFYGMYRPGINSLPDYGAFER